jgi:hypothetical protein
MVAMGSGEGHVRRERERIHDDDGGGQRECNDMLDRCMFYKYS